jgi:hypothetical protein
MAATDTLNEYLRALSEQERGMRQKAIDLCRSEILAARSEEARLRVVHDFIREAAAAPSVRRIS